MPADPESPPTTLAAALRAGATHLAATSETPTLDAEVLLRHVLSIDRTALLLRRGDLVDPAHLGIYQELLQQRTQGAPVAYLTGRREFMGLDLEVTPGVLVPRPETEILVEWALTWLRSRPEATVVDVGTGSGAIALAIAAHIDAAWRGTIIAADVSEEALTVCARNRVRLGLEDRVALVEGSLLSWLGGPVDLLLANLPYLRPDQLAVNPQLAAEPTLALDGGADGLGLIRPLLRDAPRVLHPGGAVALEIDPSQRETVVSLARSAFPAGEIAVVRDLAGWDRHVTIDAAPTASRFAPSVSR
jgi:release factor glutamine methyltransferase